MHHDHGAAQLTSPRARTDRRLWGGIVALVVLALAGFGWWMVGQRTTGTPAPAPTSSEALAPSPAEPAPKTPAPRPPAPKAVRVQLTPPDDVPPPPATRRQIGEKPITADDRRAMNYAVDAVLQEARVSCLEPFLAKTPDAPDSSEFVFDALLFDGQLADIGMRSLSIDVPADVVGCVADAAWYNDWPTWDLDGELRLQRSFDVPKP